MSKTHCNEMLFWKKLAERNKNKPHIDQVLGKYKSEEFRKLVKKWVNNGGCNKILKTDLREEAFGEDEILFSLSTKNSQICAVDISEETTKNAYIKQKVLNLDHQYVTADVRRLPFKDNTFDLILSNSTLDHFVMEDDLIRSLVELKRVMKPAGILIITINNKCNVNFFLLLKIERALRLIPYPVQSYRPKRLRHIFKAIDLPIHDEDVIVHIISPINSILLILRRFLNGDVLDKVAKRCIQLARWLGERKKTKMFTGWFIALKCVKEVT